MRLGPGGKRLAGRTIRVIRLLAAVACLLPVACGEAGVATIDEVVAEVDSGADCRQIYEVRNRMDPKDPDRPLANEHLQSIGCFGIDSVRESGAPRPLTGDPAAVSQGCRSAMQAAEAELDDERADPLIIATLSACSTATEWVEALRLHPGALGLAAAAVVDEARLESVCYGAEATPVCTDAAARGLLQ